MAKLLDDFCNLTQPSSIIEVSPETMLDYAFVQNCSNVQELNAVYSKLLSGQYGKFPVLEETVLRKLDSLLETNQKNVSTSSQPPDESISSETNGLHKWIESINGNKTRYSSFQSSHPIRKTPDVRFALEITETERERGNLIFEMAH
jgi:hypothetical protein